MNALEIAGVAIYSPKEEEIIQVIKSNWSTNDEEKFCACVHAVGHLVRRFRIDVKLLQIEVMEKSKSFGDSRPVAGAIDDMNDDIETFT